MNPEWVRERCLSFPQATEQVVWGNDLTFKVAGKMFAHTVLEPAPVWLSFKASSENFHELTERQGIVPAPYLARAQWIALESRDALAAQELATLLRESYELVVAKLPKNVRDSLSQGVPVRVAGQFRPKPARKSPRKQTKSSPKPSRRANQPSRKSGDKRRSSNN